MRLAKYTFFSILLGFFLLLAACATTTDPGEAYPGETPDQIYQGGEDALRDKNYAEAIKRFEALDAQYPYGHNAETAQLHIIYAYYMNSDYVSAEAAADRFIHAHPANPHVDYAYYMRGLSNYYQNMGVFERLFKVDFATRDLTQVKKSFNDFAQLQNHYPNSPFAPAAHQYTIYLRDVLAKHQLEVAQYYFNREAYVASANRASIVVENYQGTPSVPDALVMMAKSYYQLHLTDQMNQTIQVINYNYPNSKYADKVSGRNLSSKRFSVVSVSRKDVTPVPVQKSAMIPPADARVTNQDYSANGNRGGVTVVSDLVKSMRASGLFHRDTQKMPEHFEPVDNKQTVTAQGQVQPQQSQAQQNVASQQSQPQRNVATQQPQQASMQQRADATPQGNGSRTKNSSAVTLGSMLDSLSNSSLLSVHPKKQQADAQQSTQHSQQLAQNAPAPQQQVVQQDNGTRR